MTGVNLHVAVQPHYFIHHGDYQGVVVPAGEVRAADRAPEERVAGEERLVPAQEVAHAARRMPRRGDDFETKAGEVQRLSVFDPVVGTGRVFTVTAVDGNKATASGSAGRQVHAFNSVFEGNRILGTAGVGVGVVSYVDTVVNCTFVNNDGNSLSSPRGNSHVRNVLVLGAGATGFNGFDQIADYCFTDSTTPLPGEHSGTATADELFSPASGDWRLAAGAAASNSGEVAALDSVPSDYRDVDFYGRPRKTGDTVSCGAAEESERVKPIIITFSPMIWRMALCRIPP